MARWLIWSEEHGAWWMPDRRGYTRILRKAGRYSLEQARELVEAANEFVDPPRFHEIALEDPVPGYDAARENESRQPTVPRAGAMGEWDDDEEGL